MRVERGVCVRASEPRGNKTLSIRRDRDREQQPNYSQCLTVQKIHKQNAWLSYACNLCLFFLFYVCIFAIAMHNTKNIFLHLIKPLLSLLFVVALLYCAGVWAHFGIAV